MNCKVIATSFSQERIIRTPSIEVLRFPDHYQEIRTSKDALTQIQAVIAFELAQKPGMPLDIIIVNSDCNFQEGNEYLNSIDGTSTNYGTIKVLNKPNNRGWSFGAFAYAFEKFKDRYDYWLFTEDDIMVGGRNYFLEAVEKFNNSKESGFVAMIKVCNHPAGQHAGGGIGLTHKDVLTKVVEEHGYLPHFRGQDDQSLDVKHRRAEVIQYGEVPFTSVITKLGYRIIPFGNELEWDLSKNRIVPYYDYKNGKQYYVTT